MHPDGLASAPAAEPCWFGLMDGFGTYRGFCEHEDLFPDDEHNV